MAKNRVTFTCSPADDNTKVVVTTYTFPNGEKVSSRNVDNSRTLCDILNKAKDLSDYERGFLSGLIDLL